MKTDNWMPLWIGDYLADTGRLTTEQHGAYLLLIMDYWRNGAPPEDDAILATITKLTPSQWRKHGPVVRAFFTRDNGKLIHKRIEQEIAATKERAEKAARKAQAAAQARWGNASGSANGNAPSIGQALHKGCPSPSPSQSITSTSNTLGTPATSGVCEQAPTKAGEVCKALKAAGMASVSPSHPELLALLERGVALETFAAAATEAVSKGKGFAYMLGIVKGQITSASAIAGLQSVQQADPESRAAIEAEGQAKGLGRWDEIKEPWHAYKARVRGNKPPAVDPGVAALVSGAIKTTRATA